MAKTNDYSGIKALKSHDEVKTLQTFLADKGYNIGAKGVDGWYGNKTKAALMQFQKDNGLKVDGIVGDKTIAVMNGGGASVSPGATTPTTSTSNPKIKPKTTSTSTSGAGLGDVTKLSDNDLYKALETYKDVNSAENKALEKELIKRSQAATTKAKETTQAKPKTTPKTKTPTLEDLVAEQKREEAYKQDLARGRSVGVLKQDSKPRTLSEAFDAGDRSNPNANVFTSKDTRNKIAAKDKQTREGNEVAKVVENGGVRSKYNSKTGGTDYWTYRKVQLKNGKILFQKVNTLGGSQVINESEYNMNKNKKK